MIDSISEMPPQKIAPLPTMPEELRASCSHLWFTPGHRDKLPFISPKDQFASPDNPLMSTFVVPIDRVADALSQPQLPDRMIDYIGQEARGLQASAVLKMAQALNSPEDWAQFHHVQTQLDGYAQLIQTSLQLNPQLAQDRDFKELMAFVEKEKKVISEELQTAPK